jgi:sulfatase modifying factor 1
MIGRLVHAVHFLIAGVYAITALSIFLSLIVLSTLAPMSTILFLDPLEVEFGRELTSIIICGGVLASVFILIGFVKAIPLALGKVLVAGDVLNDPQTLATIADVCKRVDGSHFAGIILSQEINIGTYYTVGGKYLIIGEIPLQYLSDDEFRAVLAHECAHHHYGAMLPNRIHNRNVLFFHSLWRALSFAQEKIGKYASGKKKSWFMSNNIVTIAASWVVLPSSYLALGIYGLFVHVAGFLLRHQTYEFYCDSIAAIHFGPKSLASALVKLRDLTLADKLLTERLQRPRDFRDIASFAYVFTQIYNSSAFKKEKRRMSLIASKSHPSVFTRLAKLGVPEEDLELEVGASEGDGIETTTASDSRDSYDQGRPVPLDTAQQEGEDTDSAAAVSLRSSPPTGAKAAWIRVAAAVFAVAIIAVGLKVCGHKPDMKTEVNSRDGLTYVWIPPGTFQMGCSSSDKECSDDERPIHSVTITKGFWIGQMPVTQAAYQRVTRTNPSRFEGDQRPVEIVGWDDAVAYCSAVGMRLPTEAEWEYAARAGTTDSMYGAIDSIAWYWGNSRPLFHPDHQTRDVGQKQPNAWLLYDMLGNVRQWTADWYDPDYYSRSPAHDPHGPTAGRLRSLRGASWRDAEHDVRSSNRNRDWDFEFPDGFGFRCAGETVSLKLEGRDGSSK